MLFLGDEAIIVADLGEVGRQSLKMLRQQKIRKINFGLSSCANLPTSPRSATEDGRDDYSVNKWRGKKISNVPKQTNKRIFFDLPTHFYTEPIFSCNTFSNNL